MKLEINRNQHSDSIHQKTSRALLWMNLSNEPFIVLYALLPFIFRKDLNASLLAISILTALRPVLPVFSFYWSANLTNRPDLLRSNLILAWAFGRLPFLFVPWFANVWYLIFCCAAYEFFNKSGIPALIEILKINIPKDAREKTYTFYFVLSFVESILLGLVMAGLLDFHPSAWQFLCGFAALVSLSSIWVQLRVPIEIATAVPAPLPPFKVRVVQPWKDAFALLRKRPDFAQFQWGFMMGGFGLMLIAPSLSIFYVDMLNLEHTQIVTGRSILMGVGIVLSSYFWKKGLSKLSVPQLTIRILIGFGLFPLVLLLSLLDMQWFYLAFILYGIAQAGSHLLWNLSGTLFAKDEDSSQYSRVNILMVGLRGIVAPALGGLMCSYLGPVPMLVFGTLICAMGAVYMRAIEKKFMLLPRKSSP
ncbi:MAG: MFS transporter [Verrucomicrobia bacterium]|nr:MFS transporter [Verrucomicrobiota bacterium]